jgi:hypothetical protein
VNGPTTHRGMFKEMLAASLVSLTGRPNISEAWREILKSDDIIGIKFNRSGQGVLGTTEIVADVLVTSLLDAGWDPRQLVCVEAPAGLQARFGLATARPGFDATPTDFGSGTDQLASVLKQVTALINVPFLKSHNIAGMTCALKNLSHAFVKHPARYHRNGCSPYIADIVNLPEIRNKLRLCLVDALRVVYDGGPEARADSVSDEGLLLTSFDPVAIDAVGLEVLNEVRHRNGLQSLAASPAAVGYLAAAHRNALGIAIPHGIHVVRGNPS